MAEPTMNRQPGVSVILNFYNAASFLREAVESVLAQTDRAWELLLVDDASTDGSSDIARRCATRHPTSVRYLEHPDRKNHGASASRNLGGRHAKGRFIAFLDADDVWVPEKLQQQVAILEAHPEVGMVYGPGRWWYGWTGKPNDVARDFVQSLRLQAETVVPVPQLLQLFLRDEGAGPSPPGVRVRRDILGQVGGWEERIRSIYDDQVLYAKISLAAPAYVSRSCWYWYRQHPNQRVNVTMQTGQQLTARREFLTWLQTYMARHDETPAGAVAALDRALRPYHNRLAYLLAWANNLVKQGTLWAKNTVHRVLPAPAYRWVRRTVRARHEC